MTANDSTGPQAHEPGEPLSKPAYAAETPVPDGGAVDVDLLTVAGIEGARSEISVRLEVPEEVYLEALEEAESYVERRDGELGGTSPTGGTDDRTLNEVLADLLNARLNWVLTHDGETVVPPRE